MEYETRPYVVYVKLDENNLIAAVNSSAFINSTDDWTEIDRGYTQRHHHAQGNYFDKPIMDERGICRYTLEDGKPVERTQEEMDADWDARPKPVPKPDQANRIDALEKQLAAYEAAYLEGVNEA